MSDELTLLKEQALIMGVSHSPNIGVDALKKKIAEHGNPPSNDPPEDELPVDKGAKANESVTQRNQRIRNNLIKEETKLIRVRIANMNPAKASLAGEIITVGNKYIGTLRHYVPFGEGSENGWHLPKMIVDELRSREFNQVRTRKHPQTGQQIVEQRLIKEYSIEVLEPLTKDELEKLARTQAAAAGQ